MDNVQDNSDKPVKSQMPSHNSKKKYRDWMDWLQSIANFIIPIFMLIALVFTYCANENTKMSIKLAEKSNERLQKLFEAQVRPLVQSTPIDEQFVLKKGRPPDTQWYATTALKIVNYSGFDAYNVVSDVKYHGPWNRQWMRAEVSNLKKKKSSSGLTPEEEQYLAKYHKSVKQKTDILKPEISYVHSWKGGFNPKPNNEGNYDVAVRTTWENKKGFKFDNIDYYILKPITSGKGKVYTFIKVTDAMQIKGVQKTLEKLVKTPESIEKISAELKKLVEISSSSKKE